MNVEGDSSCEPVNLGNPVEMSIFSLAECVIQLTGVTAAIEYRGLPADDPVQRCPDITRAHIARMGAGRRAEGRAWQTIAYFRLLAEPAPPIGVLDAVAAE